MTYVLIEGTTSPCVELKRGEQRTVQFTDYVQRLINGGFVKVVETYEDEPNGSQPPTEEADGGGDSTGGGQPPEPDDVAAAGPPESGAVDSGDKAASGKRAHRGARAAADSAAE